MKAVRLIAGVLIAGSAAAGCSTAGPDETINPSLFIAFFSEIPEGGALYDSRHGLYVVDSPDDGLIALVENDPFRGCRIAHLAKEEHRIDNGLVNFDETRFVDPCHGSEYDGNGRYLGGPSPRSMDRMPIEIIGDAIVIDAVGVIQLPRPGDG